MDRSVSNKRLPLLAYFISIIYLLVIAVTYNSLNPNLLRIGFWISFLGFGIWLLITMRSGRPLHFPRILFPIIVYLAWRTLTTLMAPFPILSLETALREWILLLGFLFVFNSLETIWRPSTWENALINFGLIFAFIELVLAFFWFRGWWDITGAPLSLPPVGYRAPGVFLGHPNVLAGFINLILPILLIRILQEGDWKKRVVWGLSILPFIPTLYFTSSRAGLVSGILGVGVVLALYYGPKVLPKLIGSTKKSLREILPLRYLLFALIAFLVLIGFVYLFLLQSQTITTHAPIGYSARSGIWEPAVDIIRQSPLLGHGPGSFSPLFAQATGIPPGFATSHAHNIVLQTAAESGLIGVALVLWGLLTLLAVFLRIWRAASGASKIRLAAYAGAGVAVAFQHTLDYLFESPLYALAVLILIALALHEAPSSERFAAKKAFLAPGFVLVSYFFGSLYSTSAATDYWNGINFGQEGKWEQAAELICRAAEKQASIPLHGFQCSQAQAQVYFETRNAENLEFALAIQAKTLENDPYWPIHWANLASLEWAQGSNEDALEHMRVALGRATYNATLAINLAWMEEQSGDSEAASDTYQRALQIDPWLQFKETYTRSSSAIAALGRYQENNELSNLAIQGWESLTFNRVQEAEAKFEQALAENPADSRAYAGLALVQEQQGQYQEAWRNAQIAIFLDSSSPGYINIGGMIAQIRGRSEVANDYFQFAFDLIEDKNYSQSYYYRTYFRFSLPSDLVPQVLRGNLTDDMLGNFSQLAEHRLAIGDLNGAEQIRRRLEIESKAWSDGN